MEPLCDHETTKHRYYAWWFQFGPRAAWGTAETSYFPRREFTAAPIARRRLPMLYVQSDGVSTGASGSMMEQ